MRNIQVIDGARNCAYDIFSATEEDFRVIFPSEGQDVEFINDVLAREKEDLILPILERLWSNRQDKKSVKGIHGTLFYELDFKKVYYPTKKESDFDVPSGLRR